MCVVPVNSLAGILEFSYYHTLQYISVNRYSRRNDEETTIIIIIIIDEIAFCIVCNFSVVFFVVVRSAFEKIEK